MLTNPIIGAYVRVSSEERAKEGFSIESQTRMLEMYCKSQGWEKVRFYTDPGFSAKDTNRPAFQLLQKDIEQGKVNVLLVFRLDRMTRSVRDLFDILNFLDNHQCGFKSATENYDTTTAMGRMFIGLVGLLAQWERENLGERVAINMKEKILIKNEASGLQPFGYKIVDKKRVIDEEEKEVVLLMVSLFKSLRSIAAVSKELNRRNIPTRNKKANWSHQTVRQVLRNPALCGTVSYANETVENAFEGILTTEEFVDLSRRIERQNLIRLHAPTRGLFSGILRCPQCNKIMVKTEKRYRCNKCYENGEGLVRVSENDMKEAFIKFNINFELNPIVDKAKKTPTRSIEDEIKKLEHKRIKFQQMYADDFMTYEEFQKHIKENREMIMQLEEERVDEVEEIKHEDLIKFRWMMLENFEVLTYEEMVDFMSLFVKEITFNRKCVKRDKNGDPKKYEVTIIDVKFNRL